jgi:uncharacterized protein
VISNPEPVTLTQEDAPTALGARIRSLDVLRGFAVLGILVMNVQSFSMIQAAYINPTAYGDLTGLNKWVWILAHIFACEKFMTVFSVLFGAGIVLLTQRLESKGRSAAGVHYRRTFWLIVIALIHAYVFWYGDILFVYGLSALLVFLFRTASAKKLLIAGLAVVTVPSILYLMFGLSVPYWPPEALQSNMATWSPGPEAVAAEVEAYRGGWIAQMDLRVAASVFHQTFLILIWYGWRVVGLMMAGMALFKWGVLSAERSNGFYWKAALLGLGAGLPIVAAGVVLNFAEGWRLEFSMFLGWQFNYWGSFAMAFGYIGLVMLFCQSNLWPGVKALLANVGQMAFSNYLLQTLICTTLFYGHGFGLFGRVDRTGQILIVFGVWIVLVLLSRLWLRSFRFGPMEWLWRSLTYLRRQPFRLLKAQAE